MVVIDVGIIHWVKPAFAKRFVAVIWDGFINKAKLLFLCLGTKAFHDIASESNYIDNLRVIRKASILCLRDIKEILEEPAKMLGGFVRFVYIISCLVIDLSSVRIEC